MDDREHRKLRKALKRLLGRLRLEAFEQATVRDFLPAEYDATIFMPDLKYLKSTANDIALRVSAKCNHDTFASWPLSILLSECIESIKTVDEMTLLTKLLLDLQKSAETKRYELAQGALDVSEAEHVRS